MKAHLMMITVLVACGKPTGGDEREDAPNGSNTGSDGDSGGMSHGDVSLGCKLDPPAGAQVAAAPKPYAGTCPTIAKTTTQDIVITSSGNQRKFWLVVPADYDPNERLPVIFLWHWLGGSAQDFFDRGDMQTAVNQQRFLGVIPQAKGDLQFTWPATTLESAARLEEDAVFFDNMLTCISQQFNVDANCVSSAGVSAGALWTAQLVGARGDWIASFMSLSGGTGGGAIKPWKAPTHKLPGFVLWGGSTDSCGGLLNFGSISHDLEQNMTTGGHFVVECVHNCGHSVPPFEAPMNGTTFKSLWQFGLDHPFWLYPKESPYNQNGLPAELPEWCGIGMGNAMPRTGTCIDASEC